METTSHNEIRAHLAALGLNNGIRSLVVHSSLISFGRLESSPQQILEAIQSFVADDCTIFAPTFTLNLQPDDVFDPLATRSHGMGVLSEHIRKLEGALRSACPMHSYAGCGPRASILGEVDPAISFGPNSCFDKMRTLDPHLLLLGCPFHFGATHIHQVEAEVGVPFRSWLDLKRTVAGEGNVPETINMRYYGIRDRQTTQWSPVRVLQQLQKLDQITEQPAAHGKSYLLKIADLDSAVRSVLSQDVNALDIKNQTIAA